MRGSNNARPTLGFDTKKDAIAHLHGKGLAAPVIADEIGSTTGSVITVLSRLKLPRHPDTSLVTGPQALFVTLAPELVQLARPHAAKRGLSCAALVARIVDTVLLENLVDATLDDREG